MGDSFKSPVIRLDVPGDTSIWELVDYLATYARRALEQLPGRIHKADFTVWDKSGSNLTRDSMAELREAVRSHHLDVNYFYGSVNLAAPGALPWHEDTAVTVWADLGEGEKPDRARVVLESRNKIQMDGLHAQIRQEVEHLRQHSVLPSDWPARVPVSAVAAPAVETASPVEPSLGTSYATPSPSSARPGSTSWLSRTWRDHTATFVVTVAGGLVVAALATWLGLQVI